MKMRLKDVKSHLKRENPILGAIDLVTSKTQKSDSTINQKVRKVLAAIAGSSVH